MAHKPKVRWSEAANAWRCDVGPKGPSGRRAAVHFRTRDLPGGGVEELPNTATGRKKATELLDIYLGERDKVEAQAEVDRLDPPLRDVVDLYLEHIAATKAPRTLDGYTERLQTVQGFRFPDGSLLGNRRVGSLTHADGVRMVKKWQAAGHGPNYITNCLLLTLKACLNWAAKVIPDRQPPQIVPANPWAALVGPEPEPGERELVSRPELAAFLRLAWAQANAWKPDANRRCSGCRRADTPRQHRCTRCHAARQTLARTTVLLIRCQYHCGTRPGELCAATWQGWEPRAYRDPDTGQWWGLISIRGKNTAKKKVMRSIPVRPSLARAIERIRAIPYHDPTYIFAHLAREAKGDDARHPTKGDAWPPAVVRWADSGELARRVRLLRIGGIALARDRMAGRLIRGGMTPEAAAAQSERTPPPFDPKLTLYTLRHSFYTDAIEGGETFERAGAVGDTGAATIEKTYFRNRKRSRFETAKRIGDLRRKVD